MERYVFFPACAERFGTARPALLDQGRDEDADQGMLAAALRVLLEVMHQLLLILAGCLKLTSSFAHALSGLFAARTRACCHACGLLAGARPRKGPDNASASKATSSLMGVISGRRVWCRCAGMLTQACVQVHASVFAAAEGAPARDVRAALAAARRRVLAGVRICFSAVIPRGAAAPRAHALWRLAEEVRPARPGSPMLVGLCSHWRLYNTWYL